MAECQLVVKTDSICKVFEGKEILKKCSINVREGSIYGFLGANGAGKTTVFKILIGLLNPTSGKANVLGMDTATNREKILRNVGSLIEVPIFYDHLSAHDNLNIHLEYMNTKGIGIDEVLELVGLDVNKKELVANFSLGMRQRLGIARAIIHNPRLLILDEPINGLDPMGIKEMRELFIRLTKERNMTILLSSHIISEVEQVADTIGVIVNGEIKAEIELNEIKETYPDGLEKYFFEIMREGHVND